MTRRCTLLLALASALFCFQTAALGISIFDVVNGVTQADYTGYHELLYVHNGNNRGIGGAQHDLARTNIFNTLQSFGLTTTLDSFTYNSTTYYNVVGRRVGTSRPNDIYIVGAHYDSVNNPGADDNASGVAGVMVAAHILTQYPLDATVVFIAFDREEQGLYGSFAYVAAHSGDNILGMISLDMIAYNPAGGSHNTALLYGYGQGNPLEDSLASALLTYGGITSTEYGALASSDHWPFQAQGKPACLLIEGAVWGNPYYHQQTDSVDSPNYIDYAYATNMTRGAVAYLAANAVNMGEIPEPNCIVILIIAGLARFARRRRA